LRSKNVKVSENWWEVWREQQARAFTVARGSKLSVLHTIRGALLKSLERGTTERDFIKELKPRLMRRGWWGRRQSDGAMLGSHRRLKTIYRTNMASAYNAGRYREQKRQAELEVGAAPWWQYVAVLDQRTRDQHRVLDGKVFRHDDPFWDHFYPPNGFNCRCRVRALTDAMLKRRKLKPESSEGKLSWRRETLLDRRTGVFTHEPKKVRVFRGKDVAGRDFSVSPHAGFDYNPGQAWSRWSPEVRVAAPGKPADFRKIGVSEELRGRAPAPKLLPKAINEEEAIKAIVKTLLGERAWRVIKTPDGEKAIIHRDWVPHIVEERVGKVRDPRERFAKWIIPTLEDADEIWLVGDRKRFIKVFESGKGNEPMLLVLEERADGFLLWTGYRVGATRINKQRLGTLLYSRELQRR